MKPKQNKNYIVGIYARLSRDDGQDSESTSIENQRLILTKYVKEQGWTLHDVYVDDGISGTTFERPGVQKLLDDAKKRSNQYDNCKRPFPFWKKLYSSRTISRLRLSDVWDKVYRYSR